MELRTDRLLLRPLGLKDLKTVYEYTSDLENTKYMLFFPDTTEQETKDFLCSAECEWQQEHPVSFAFAIVLDNVLIGDIFISHDEKAKQGEIGWILNKKYWNCGYASEAAAAVLDLAKNHLHLQKVIAQCDWRNGASVKVMEKIGMRLIDDKGMRTYIKREESARELTYCIEF